MLSPVSATSFRDSRPSRRERLVSAAISLALCLLLLVMLINMGAFGPMLEKRRPDLVAVDVRPQAAAKSPQHRRVTRSAGSPAVSPVPVPVPLPVPITPPVPPFKLIPLTRDEMAAADIGRMPKRGAGAAGQGPADGSGDNGTGGDGPGGAHLYNAEWHREPTRAELDGYMHGVVTRPGDWAEIACRTIDHFHVEDCRELRESPPGSGFARALRQAGWQFLIRPPRINGKVMVGTWVRIHYQITGPRSGESASADQP